MASQRLSESDLKNMGLVWNELKQCYAKVNMIQSTAALNPTASYDTAKFSEIKKSNSKESILRTISLKLFGEPMPKQSVRAYATGRKAIGKSGNERYVVDFNQPKEQTDRSKDYIRQIRAQIPIDFKMFESRVHIIKMHFIFSPLKRFSKSTMDRIKEGEIIYKETRPDLSDNLKKGVLDSMSKLIYKDDGLIVSEDNVKKYYGTGGLILIELSGL